MKKENLSNKSISITIGLILLVVILVLILPIGPAFNQVTRPLQEGIYSAGQYIRERAVFANNIKAVISDNNELENKVKELEKSLIELEKLKDENKSLRDQLDFTERRDLEFFGADVINYQTDGARQILRINAGVKNGLEKEMMVISRGHVIGVVQEVSNSSSTVRLITDPSFRISAVIKENEAQGLIKGRLGGSVIMDKIPQFETPSIGDQVLTSGLGDNIPSSLRIGTVSAVSENPDSVFSQAQIEIPFDPRTVKTVLVITE